MNYLRKLVSGKRHRLKYSKYDLDITYVTKRICGMSFPASGFEQVYRNNINDVVAFLEERHKDSYLIINLSNRKYDYKKFKNRVLEYKWEDHHSPALSVLFEVCQEMYNFLKVNHENIAIVNCNAGKGRTGTSIACFMMFSGLADNSNDAITYYGWQRFSHGRGVTQPCQVRYIHYFEGVYKRQIQSPSVKILEKIVITTVPQIQNGGCTPFIEVLSGKDFELLWTNKYSQNLKSYKAIKHTLGNQDSQSNRKHSKITIEIDQDPLLCGDIYFRLLHKGQFQNKLISRFALNTSFIEDNRYEFTKQTVDPDSIIKDDRFSNDFKVECFFRDFCDTCHPSIPLEALCSKCTKYMQEEISSWKIIRNILDNHKYPSNEEGVFMNFNSNQCDFNEVIKKKLPINCEQFQYFEEVQGSEYEYFYSESLGLTGDAGSFPGQKIESSALAQEKSNLIQGSTSYDEELKSQPLMAETIVKAKGGLVREAVSDTEDQDYSHQAIIRKNEMLNIDNFEDEFQIKSGAIRRKSVDFNKEKQTAIKNKLMTIQMHRIGGSIHRQKASKKLKHLSYID